ncbi:MAG: transcriptional regulator [Clostridiales bacterium]|jgi:predicted transcriptional regulator of viral defense system|nr:transcriptional regulator [Clostridiales bacterium]
MKYYKELLRQRCFTRADVIALTGSEGAANSLLHDYQKKGYIEQVKRNLYVAVSMETEQSAASRYYIGSHITEGSYLSHHSAFEYFGCANQVFYEVYVSGGKRFAPFEYDDVMFRYVAPRISPGMVERPDGVRVTDIERTVLDSIGDFEKIAGLEELLHCLELVPYLDEIRLLAYLDEYRKQVLYQKTGYILEHLKKDLRLSEGFFEACESKVSKSVRYLYQGVEHEPNTYNKRWRLYVPQNLMKLISREGVTHGSL